MLKYIHPSSEFQYKALRNPIILNSIVQGQLRNMVVDLSIDLPYSCNW